MTIAFEKKALQCAVALACLVPLSAGLSGMIEGAALLGGGSADMDSHFRYLSGLLLAIGTGFLTAIPAIERSGKRFRLLTFLVMTGGIGRLAGLYTSGMPGIAMRLALVMELVITPILCLWQSRITRLFNKPI